MFTLKATHHVPHCFYLQAPSESHSTNESPEDMEKKQLTPESIARVNATVEAAMKIIEITPET